MRFNKLPAFGLGLVLGASALALPAAAQDTAPPAAPPVATPAPVEAPAVTPAPMEAPAATGTLVVVPEGFTLVEFTAVTAEELVGVNVYDAEGSDIASISDLEIGADNTVTKVVLDVGGFLGIGTHTVGLTPEQIEIYRNADNDLRAHVSMDKDALKALPEYVAPGG